MYTIAKYGLLAIFLATIAFHTLALMQVVPYSILWGGRITSLSQMYVFESVSIAVNVLFLLIVLLRYKIISVYAGHIWPRYAIFGMGLLFLVNTAGNYLSLNSLEKLIFTPITFLLAVLCFISVYARK